MVEVVDIAPRGPKRALVKRKPGSKGIQRKPSKKRAQRKIKAVKWKFKKSELRKLDDHFSLKIRKRDGKCLFPNCTVTDIAKLQCSHYEGRARWETRFDEDNCIALCWFHHYKSKLLGYEYQKQKQEIHGFDGQYTRFMKEFLGETRFNALVNKEKKTRKEVMQEYKALVDNSALLE